jgi:hypothetical protein
MHWYGRATDVLVADAFGAGHLTAMHILGVATCIGLMPERFLNVAEVGVTTKTWKFLKWAFAYMDETAEEDTNVLLRAASVYLSIPIKNAEELLCVSTKLMAPPSSVMEEEECIINFETCDIIVDSNAKAATGDVVYKDMSLYRLHADDKLHRLLCSGILEPADPLLHDNVLLEMGYQPSTKFWRRKLRKGTYHYTRCKPKRCKSTRDYFVADDVDDDEYVPRSTRTRERCHYAENHIVFGLCAPHPQTIVTAFYAREPLNLKSIIWRCIGGTLGFKQEMFHFQSHRMETTRPPCVHPNFATISRRCYFYSCTLLPPDIKHSVPVTQGRYWPDPNFDMHPFCTNEVLAPIQWRRTIHLLSANHLENNEPVHKRRRGDQSHVDHSKRMEPVYPWNCYRRVACTESPYGHVMVFNTKAGAINFAMLEFLFNQKQLLDLANPQVRSLFFMPPMAEKRGRNRSSSRRRTRRVNNAGAILRKGEDIRVFYDPIMPNSKTEKHPQLIAIKYKQGGRLYYFCDGSGRRVSCPLLQRPTPVASRLERENKTLYDEFLCIATHDTRNEESSILKKKIVYLNVIWLDKTLSGEPMLDVFQTAPYEVLNYAVKNRLLDEVGWARVRSLHRSIK